MPAPQSLADLLADECRDRFRRAGRPAEAPEVPTDAPIRTTRPEKPLPADIVVNTGADETSYAVKFLAFVYGVPFRLVAIQQELSDIFDFRGEPSPEFLSRFQHWQEPQREAFRALLVEQQRLQMMQSRFENVERVVSGLSLSHEDLAAAFASAHEDATEEWSTHFGGSAAVAATQHAPVSAPRAIHRRSSAEPALPPGVDNIAGVGMQLTMALNDTDESDAADATGHGAEGTSSFTVGAATHLARTPTASGAFTFRVPSDIRRDAVAGADVLQSVLDATARYEIDLAERRYQARLRWVSGLTKQQRSAVVHRYLGNRRRDTAELLGISEQSVKTHLQRADAEWEKYEVELHKPARVKGSSTLRTARAVSQRDVAQTS
jgi:DNA-binding CsgD family transcriptional regulator